MYPSANSINAAAAEKIRCEVNRRDAGMTALTPAMPSLDQLVNRLACEVSNARDLAARANAIVSDLMGEGVSTDTPESPTPDTIIDRLAHAISQLEMVHGVIGARLSSLSMAVRRDR